ncbi:hypothetical protein ABKV19_013615 [Rosa sericea]
MNKSGLLGVRRVCKSKEKKKKGREVEGSRERKRNGKQQAVGTHRGVLQEEGRVEEAPDAFESAPPRHSRPRHRSGGLRRLLGRRAVLQPRHLSSSFSLLLLLFSLRIHSINLFQIGCSSRGMKSGVSHLSVPPFWFVFQ